MAFADRSLVVCVFSVWQEGEVTVQQADVVVKEQADLTYKIIYNKTSVQELNFSKNLLYFIFLHID